MILLCGFILTFTAVAEATNYRAWVNGAPTTVSTVASGGVLQARVDATLPASFAISAIGVGGESERSNAIVLAQAVATPTPTQASVATATRRPTPIAPNTANQHNVTYMSGRGTGWCRDNLCDTSDWRISGALIPFDAVADLYTINTGGYPAYAAVTVNGQVTALHCQTDAGQDECWTKSGAQARIMPGQRLGIWMSAVNEIDPAETQNSLRLRYPNGDPYPALIFAGGGAYGDPLILPPLSYVGDDGATGFGALYGLQTDPKLAAWMMPCSMVNGVCTAGTPGRVAAICGALEGPLEAGVTETYTLLNLTTGERSAVPLVLDSKLDPQGNAGYCVTGVNQWLFPGEYFTLEQRTSGTPTRGHYRNWTIAIEGVGQLYSIRGGALVGHVGSNKGYGAWANPIVGMGTGVGTRDFYSSRDGIAQRFCAEQNFQADYPVTYGLCVDRHPLDPCVPKLKCTLQAPGKCCASGTAGIPIWWAYSVQLSQEPMGPTHPNMEPGKEWLATFEIVGHDPLPTATPTWTPGPPPTCIPGCVP